MKKILAILLLVLLFGCSSQPTIDASSDEALKASIENVQNSLSDDKKMEFRQAVLSIALQSFDPSQMMQQSGSDNDDATMVYLQAIKDRIDGKTADEIIALAESLRKESEGN